MSDLGEVFMESGHLHYREGNKVFALPKIDAIPFPREDRDRALAQAGRAYKAAHDLKQEVIPLAYFALRYETFLAARERRMGGVIAALFSQAERLELQLIHMQPAAAQKVSEVITGMRSLATSVETLLESTI